MCWYLAACSFVANGRSAVCHLAVATSEVQVSSFEPCWAEVSRMALGRSKTTYSTCCLAPKQVCGHWRKYVHGETSMIKTAIVRSVGFVV